MANRYIALSLGANNYPTLPDGTTLSGNAVTGATDIDQLFNTLNPRTLKGLQEVFQGGAESYAGVTHDVNVTAEYFAPALASADHFFGGARARPAHVRASSSCRAPRRRLRSPRGAPN